VLRVEAWTTIRYLHAQGTPIRAICRELGVSRKAVRRALRGDEPPIGRHANRLNGPERWSASSNACWFMSARVRPHSLRGARLLPPAQQQMGHGRLGGSDEARNSPAFGSKMAANPGRGPNRYV